MQIQKTVCRTFNTWKEVFSLSTAPTFPHILVPIWSLSLPRWEVLSPGTALGASASAPIKAHHRVVSRKTSYLRRFFFFICSNIPRLPDATDYLQRWTAFHKWRLQSNIVCSYYTQTVIPSPDQIFHGKMVRADHYSWNFGPPDQFFRRTKISVTD